MADRLKCKGCGVEYQGHPASQYCSRACWPSQQNADGTKRRLSYVYRCAVCGKIYAPKRKERSTTCSRECGFAWLGIKKSAQADGLRVKHQVERGRCLQCGKPFAKVSPLQDRCSDDCRRLHARSAWAAKTHKARDCRVCGQRFVPADRRQGPYATCSEHCRLKLEDQSKRVSRSARKAREKGAKVIDLVDPIQVLMRDRWSCRRCGIKTPRRLRGSFHPHAPEVDHIVPLAKGGEHSYANTQCLCRSCNIRKSDTLGDQMRAVDWSMAWGA